MQRGSGNAEGGNHTIYMLNGTTIPLAFTPDGRRESRGGLLVESADVFHLTATAASELIDAQVDTIRADWDDVCDRAELTRTQRMAFWGTQFLNPYVFS